ncbi:kinase-like protein [Hypoxylon sp. NC1633]|nr:kinase-like protein [Hypoxylon sp. NC1633]
MELQNERDEAASAASTMSWNTFLSRTSVSTLSSAAFSESGLSSQARGLDDVLSTVKALSLPRFQYDEIERQDVVGEGETFVVECCVVRSQVFAVKHLKTNPDDPSFQRRLQSVLLEIRIMRHAPLRSHPNILTVFGYGWNMRASQIAPYLLVQYAPYGTLRQYLRHFKSEISITHKEILLGDIAAATSALHLCGIIHGDIKLDNVLVFHSWDRPTKSIAKIADFGHSLVITGKDVSDQDSMRYRGTSMLVILTSTP